MTSDGERVTVDLVYVAPDGTLRPRVSTGGDGPATSPCTYRLVMIPTAAEAYSLLGDPPTPDAVPYWLMCGGALVRPMWIAPAEVVDPADIVRGEARRYLDTVLGPALTIGVAPLEFAVTGVPANFWITGWDGAPIAVPPINPFGATIDITLQLDGVTWDFGDDTAATSGDLGRPHPAASTVRHNYTQRSTSPADPDGAHTTTATITIAVSYRLDAGPAIPVTPPLTATVSAPVIVRQAQVVLS